MDPDRDGLTVEEIGREPLERLERVTERVAEVEESTLALLALVARDDPGLEGDAAHDDRY